LGDLAEESAMHASRQPKIRPCPICGVAMQASKSRDDLAAFDVFHCQTCETTITETPQRPADGGGGAG
jgi:hypothetical protein